MTTDKQRQAQFITKVNDRLGNLVNIEARIDDQACRMMDTELMGQRKQQVFTVETKTYRDGRQDQVFETAGTA